MPSFLNKVFGRKKDEKEASPHAANSGRRLSAPPSLLEGKYEAVSPNVSPSATHFPDVPPQAAKESPLALFRSRSRQRDQPRSSNPVPAPLLTLNLPVPKEEKGQALGVVFEADPESSGLLSDAVIGDRRLNPLETLLLVKTCSGVIVDRGGLETLGLMHPHWHSSSAEVQRKLISLFILSLGSKTPITTLSPPPPPSHIFEAELSYARSLHDVASVLRWGIRHLRLEGSSFGRQGSADAEWAWYSSFAASERDQNYPSAAFSQVLVPLLPPPHFQLLSAVLDIIESLAAHAEANGASGSKLAKVLGLWLLSYARAKPDEDWGTFYKRWERAGRILEHLFLAHVREESIANRMPLRLSELVKHYPYHNNVKAEETAGDLPLLPVPRFSTRSCDALFIRINSMLPTPTSSRPPKEPPLLLLAEAFKATASADATITEDACALWDEIKAKATPHESSDSELSHSISKVLEDETVRLLTLVSAGPESALPSPTFLISPPPLPAQLTQRSRSASSPAEGATAGTNGTAAAPSPSLTNWADFSMIGFGESNLDNNLASTLSRSEIEITQPPPTPPQKKRKVSPPADRRASADSPVSRPKAEEPKLPTTLAQVSMIQVDEAFFDFWSDTLLDPIAANWPSFVVCQLKSVSPKASLLVIEHSYTRPSPPPLSPSTASVPESSKRAASPRPSVSASVGGRKSFAFSPTIKRFSFFSTSHAHGPSAETTKHGKKASNKASAKSPRIGEMGEILPEEDEKPAPAPKSKSAPAPKGDKPVQGLGITAAPESTAPAATKAEAELPPVPLVEAELPAVPDDTVAPVATELVRTESDAPEKPVVAVPEEVSVPKDEAVTEAEKAADTEKVLPPAPEGVVLTGSTPGPEIALASSEPVALAQASEVQPEPTADAPSEPEAAPAPEAEPATEPIITANPEPQPTTEVSAMPAEESKPKLEEKPDEAVVEDAPVSIQPEEPVAAPAQELEPVHPADEVIIAKPGELMVEDIVQEAPASTVSEDVVPQDVEDKEPEVEAAKAAAVGEAPVEVVEASAESAPQEVSEPAIPTEAVTAPSETAPEDIPVPAEPAATVVEDDVSEEKTEPEVTQRQPEPQVQEPAVEEPVQEALKEPETAAPAVVEEEEAAAPAVVEEKEEAAPVAEKEEEGSEESGESPGATTPTVETAEAGTTQSGNSKKGRKQKRNRRQK